MITMLPAALIALAALATPQPPPPAPDEGMPVLDRIDDPPRERHALVAARPPAEG